MTLLEQAIEAARKLPEGEQHELAELLLASHRAPYVLTAEERKAVAEGVADADAGRFVSDDLVKALFTQAA